MGDHITVERPVKLESVPRFPASAIKRDSGRGQCHIVLKSHVQLSPLHSTELSASAGTYSHLSMAFSSTGKKSKPTRIDSARIGALRRGCGKVSVVVMGG
jgi:hypothetical protein